MPEFERVMERQIEDCIVVDPERYLESGITLIVRQPHLEDRKIPDLIGVDGGGRLVVYELKATEATFEAIRQVEGYASTLNKLAKSEIRRLIERYSGRHGIQQIPDFATWYRYRFPGQDFDDLRPCRLAIVSIGAVRSVHRGIETREAKGTDIRLVDLSGVELVLRSAHGGFTAAAQTIRRPTLQTTGSHRDQLRQNCEYYECDTLFRKVSGDVERTLRRLSTKTYPIGAWYYRPGQALMGIDVFRKGIGSVGVLLFKASVTPALRDQIDRLRSDLVWVGDTYTTDKAIDTVLVVHSLNEWAAHRDAILGMARQISGAE